MRCRRASTRTERGAPELRCPRCGKRSARVRCCGSVETPTRADGRGWRPKSKWPCSLRWRRAPGACPLRPTARVLGVCTLGDRRATASERPCGHAALAAVAAAAQSSAGAVANREGWATGSVSASRGTWMPSMQCVRSSPGLKQQRGTHQRFIRAELRLPMFAGPGQGQAHLAADHGEAYRVVGFRDHRVHLARHGGTAGLLRWRPQVAEAGMRARTRQPQVGVNLPRCATTRRFCQIQPRSHVLRGLHRVVGLVQRAAEQPIQLVDREAAEARWRVHASAHGRASQVQRVQARSRVLQNTDIARLSRPSRTRGRRGPRPPPRPSTRSAAPEWAPRSAPAAPRRPTPGTAHQNAASGRWRRGRGAPAPGHRCRCRRPQARPARWRAPGPPARRRARRPAACLRVRSAAAPRRAPARRSARWGCRGHRAGRSPAPPPARCRARHRAQPAPAWYQPPKPSQRGSAPLADSAW